MAARLFYSTVIVLLTGHHFVHSVLDEFMSCDQLYANRRQSRVLDLIPCDMKAQSFCQYKGPGYPEAAIWKFKEENRALMKRLYGDLESTSVYREMRSTLSGPSSHMSRSAQAPQKDLTFGHGFSSLEYNIRVGSGLATVQSASEPIILANNMNRIKLKKIAKKRRKQDSPIHIVTSTTTSTSVVYATTSETIPPTTTTPDSTRFQTTLQPTTVDSERMTTITVPPTEGITLFEETITMTTTTTSPGPTSTKSDSFSSSEVMDTTVNVDTATKISTSSEEIDEAPIPDLLVESKENESVSLDDLIQTSLDPETNIESVDYVDNEDPEEQEMESSSPLFSQGDFSLDEADLEDDFIYSGTPINACPVKEEVFAPYWANNTRDQVLALLNLYPFEQYIHMETCKYEKEEMLCRRGCRCEQQYRLHRLLAFDPSNECRGIFSDWFRFPSYCICKCYNVPPEFIEKKRKPRIEGFSPIPDGNSLSGQQEIRDSKVMQFEDESDSYQNIPAILPYEGTVSLLREFSNPDTDSKEVNVPEGDKKVEDHFLYGNLPVMDYKSSDTSRGQGSVDQVPRK